MSKDWFVNWFNTSYYHTLYQHRDQAEACKFIDHLCDFLDAPKNSKILDLACGKGRHAIHLANKGFYTTGVDLAEESIAYANRNKVPNVDFAVHDMRESYKHTEFDYIFNLFTSFGYFDNPIENIDVLKAVAQNLKKEGLFVLDFLNATKVIANLVPLEEKRLEGIDFILKRKFDGDNIIKDIIVRDGKKEFNFQERVSAFFLHDLKSMADIAGLEITCVFGDYNLSTFDEVNSDRLILVMKVVQ